MAYLRTNIGDTGQRLVDNLDNNFIELYARPEPVKEYPTTYHADLSTSGSQIIIPLAIYDKSDPEIYLRYKYYTTTDIAIAIRSAHTSNLVDMKRSTQWGATYVEGSSIDNTAISSTYQTIDQIVYNQSNEMHRIWVRFQDHLNTNLWSIYEINCFCSADATRTDIWVIPIYQGHSGNWR